jgi:Ca2+-transporting ATPase
MSVVRYLLSGGDVEAQAGDGGLSFRTGERAVKPDEDDRLAWALRVGALCNNADLGDGTEADRAGDPMEIALLEAAARAGLPREDLRAELPERREHAFDPERKMMATVHAEGEGARVAVKGAPEAVLGACGRVLGPAGETDLTDADREDWRRRSAEAARDGLRLLALATKRAPDAEADPYRDLTLLGLVCLLDPVRAGVPEAIADARAAGVRVVMLTGDHADTAETIAANAGLGDGALTVIRGGELAGRDVDRMSAEERERLLAADVFARVAPETKLTLVSAYQEAGHVVAMTGDGVNDAPALKKADIGIAMGRRGTEVAKQAAHMVLRDDAFDTIIAAMRQGRVIFGNIRSIVVYLLSCNVSEVLVVGLAVGAGLPAPLLPLQILYLNLVTDVYPAFALGLGRGDAQAMTRPPRDPGEAIVDRPRWQVVAVLGSFLTAATLGAFVLALAALELDPDSAVTVAFLTLALGQLWNVFNMRDPGSSLLRNEIARNPYVWGAIALCLGIVGLAVWQPALAGVLQLAPPGAAGLGLAVLASFVPLALGQGWIALRRRRQAAG